MFLVTLHLSWKQWLVLCDTRIGQALDENNERKNQYKYFLSMNKLIFFELIKIAKKSVSFLTYPGAI